MKLSVLTLCVLGACSMSAYASTTNIVNAQSQFLMSYNGNKDDSSNVRKNGSYCETRTLSTVHNFEQDKTYQGVGIKKIDKVTGTYQTVCIKDGKETSWPSYTQTYVNDIVYEYPCTRRSTEKFEHYTSNCITSKNIYSNGLIGDAVRLMRFRGEENYDRSYSDLPSYNNVMNLCETMTLESRGTPIDACEVKPNGINGTPDVIRIEDISTDNSVATIRITDNKNTTDATINYKSTKINLSKEWLNQLERVTIKNAKAKDWMFVTLKNPVGVNAGVETVLQMPYIRGAEEPPRLYLCEGSQNFNWGQKGNVEGSKVQDLSLIFNGVAGYKNIPTTGDLSISQYSCDVSPDRTGAHLEKARFPIVQGRHWEMNGGALRATWDEPERVEESHGFLINGMVGQFIKDFQTRQCNHDPYQPTEDKEVCKLDRDLHPFIYNVSKQRKGEGSRDFGVYVKPDILPLLQQGFNNIEILTIGRDKNMELTLEFTFKGNKPSISKKIEDEKNNCYGRGHNASCHEQDNENDNNTGGNNPMVPPDELDSNKDYSGWIEYHCRSQYKNKNIIIDSCKKNLKKTSRIDVDELKRTLLNDKTTYGSSKNTGVYEKEHNDIVNACNNLLESYESRLGQSIKYPNSQQQLNCRNTAHQKYRACLENKRDNYQGIQDCFKQEKTNIDNYVPDPLFEPLINEQCGKLSNGQVACNEKFTNELIKNNYKCSREDTTECISKIIQKIKGFKPDNYYINKSTDYDGWISYTCNEDLNCEREFKASKKESGDLKYDLLNYRTTFEGLLSRDYDEIKKICEQRGGELKTESGTFLKSICLNNIVTKHQSCLENNKTDLPQIQTCFNKEKKNIHFWYSERYFLEVVREQCKVRGANNAHFLTQCVNKYNAQFIQNFMNQSKGVDIEGDILPISAYEFNLKLEVDKFVPEENNYGNTSSQVKQACQKRFEQYEEGSNKTRAINGCISFVNREYEECKKMGNAASCNARITDYARRFRYRSN